MSITLEERWLNYLKDEFEADYFKELKNFLLEEKKQFRVFPPGPKIFHALNQTPFDRVKVVLLGQDPYHGFGQANGLCFSVSEGIKPPPSLQNIFKELHADLAIPIPQHGNLEAWAQRGVLLLNATLTVRENQAGSHQGKGWERFTDTVIRTLSEHRESLVFLLWGKFAQGKIPLIDTHKHAILQAPHPSPFSAHTGFLGCKHFSKTNAILQQNGISPIDWSI